MSDSARQGDVLYMILYRLSLEGGESGDKVTGLTWQRSMVTTVVIQLFLIRFDMDLDESEFTKCIIKDNLATTEFDLDIKLEKLRWTRWLRAEFSPGLGKKPSIRHPIFSG
jgi:hypothetical protein